MDTNNKVQFELVLVERVDNSHNTVLACSGIMLDNKYVIITANIFSDLVTKTLYEELPPGKLCTDVLKDISLNVVQKDGELYVNKKATILSTFVSGNIRNSNKHIFSNWAVDSVDNNRNVNSVLALFFVLHFNKTREPRDFKYTLRKWWDLIVKFSIDKGDELYIRSAPFANRNFMNSISKGIVSNILGKSSCFILSDCPCAPGCEGSPVYLCNKEYLQEDIPEGIVLSSLSWWRGEWVGLTVIADIRPIILELIDVPIKVFNTNLKGENYKLIATVECCLAQLYCGKSWGTAILLNEEKGLFITNSHIIENNKSLSLFHKGKMCDAKLIYQTPQNNVFDIALVQSDPGIIKNHFQLKSIKIFDETCDLGSTVYSSGYSLFPKECDASPSLSKGCISQINPFMIKTTCCVHPGSSGGVILNAEGYLLGIIVCNARLEDNNVVYPRINMAIPFPAISDAIFSFLKTGDATVLRKLNMKNTEAEFVWKRLEGKL